MARKTKDTSHLRLRVEAALLVRLEKAAEKNSRTLTGEITHRLSESFKGDDFLSALDRLSERATVRVGKMVRKDGRWVSDEENS
jgi:hypothetical protein